MNPVANEIELEAFAAPVGEGAPVLEGVLPFLGSVRVQVAVRVGCTELSVNELAQLRQGGVLALDRQVEEPVDVLVDGHVVARGVLVAVDEQFGVRITEPAVLGGRSGVAG